MSDGLKQCRGSVQLKTKKKKESDSHQLSHLMIIKKVNPINKVSLSTTVQSKKERAKLTL